MRLLSVQRLRAVVVLSGLTQREIAEAAGLSHGTVGNLLAGRRTGCSREVYDALLAVLGPQLATVFEPRVRKAAA